MSDKKIHINEFCRNYLNNKEWVNNGKPDYQSSGIACNSEVKAKYLFKAQRK